MDLSLASSVPESIRFPSLVSRVSPLSLAFLPPSAPLLQPQNNNPSWSLLSHWVFAEHSTAIVVSFSSHLQSTLQLLLQDCPLRVERC